MAASIGRRSAYLRILWRTTNKTTNISSPTSIRSNLLFQQTRISPPHLRSPARLRRESLLLNTLLPVHSAIASACLVSKLPNDASTSTEGRFANYLSPI